jgi:hypothetical protein
MSGIGTIAVTQYTRTNDGKLTFKTYKIQSSDVCNWPEEAEREAVSTAIGIEKRMLNR